jgi:cell division transport system permease protein
MKLFRQLKRYFRDAFKSVFRNFPLSLASISCITITLVVVAASIIITYNVENFAESIRKDVTIVVFLEKEVTDKEIKQIEKEINDTKNIEKLEFISKKQAAENTKKENEIFETIVDGWTEETNPLLDSFKIKVKDVDKIKNTVDKIKKIKKVDIVNYGEDIVDQLLVVFQVIKKISIGTVAALILVTAFLITNTIKLAIFARKTEIEIMRLVGASNIAIKIPFIIEGLFIGLLGSIIPIIITVVGYNKLYEFFGGKLFSSSLAKLIEPTPFVINISLLLLVIGMTVGMLGSYKAVKKHLKI